MATTKKVRVPLTAAEVEAKGDRLASLVVEGQKAEEEHLAKGRDHRNKKKERDKEIATLALDRSSRTEEREFEVERRPNLKKRQYEFHRFDGGGIIAAATRKMTKDEFKAEQEATQMTLDQAEPPKPKASAGSNGKAAKGGSPVKLVHTKANKPKGPAKAKPEAHPS